LAKVEFIVKDPNESQLFVRCKAEFVRDPDRQWRLKKIQIFNALGDQEIPLAF
jgi:hypothetical protein